MYKTLAVLVLLGVTCFAQAPPSPSPSLRDHNIVVGARYNDVIDTLILGANAEAQAYQGNTNHHAELSVQKLLPQNTEVHGLVGENNLNVYTNAGASTTRYTNGLNFSGKGDVYYAKDNLTHLAEVSLAKIFEVAQVVLVGGEKNLNPYARALISAAQEVAGFNVNETASLHFENNVFGNQLIVQTARALSDYLTLYLRGQVTDLRDPQALARAVLANTTVLGANVNGYAQAGLASNSLAYEAAVYATKLIAERFATRAFAGFHQTSPFAGAETSFHTDLADITAGVNANYTLGALFNAYARASRQFTQNLNGLLEGSVTGANLQGASKRVHGAVHYNENTTRGRVYANADGVYQDGQLLKSANAGVSERLTENDLLTDDLTYDVNSVLNNRATLSGAHTFSNLLLNYVITGLSDNRSGSINNVVTAAANTTLYENFFAGVRGFYQKELQGLGAYLATRGNIGQFSYKAGVAGDVNSTKSAEVRAGGLLTGLIEGLNLTLTGTGVSDITTNDIVTLSAIVSNTVQSLTVSGTKNLRGSQQLVNAEYNYNINPNLVLNVGVHFPSGAKAYAEGTLRRTSGAQNVLLYFSVDQFGQISFNKN